MSLNDKIQLFEDKRIRTAWDEEKEEWYFSIVDVVGVLTESPDYNTGRKYWNKLKQRLKEEGNKLVTKCHQLKMTAADGKKRLTDVADTEQLLRIIQSIPSPKAEPFKLWLAQVGRERIEETIDPELTIERAHAAAPPFQIEPASLGFDLVLGVNLKVMAPIVLRCYKSSRTAYRLRRLFIEEIYL